MRGFWDVVVLGVLLAGAAGLQAQILDPTTGVPVDATTDPIDFVNALTGQPTNIGMELNAQAIAQMQASQQQALQASQPPADLFSATTRTAATAAPPVSRTPKPSISRNGGKFRGTTQVTIADSDAQAVIHYTLDGSKPSLSSAIYLAPLEITAKTKVRAMALGSEVLPSGVATKTFKPVS